jgi:oxygen-independent coproporphyrinogen-3 oxidase
LTDDDVLRRHVIQKLMCEFRLDFAGVASTHGIDVASDFAVELAALAPLAADGLVTLTPSSIEVTPRGRMLVRTVAMVFDRHLREARERASYSRVI